MAAGEVGGDVLEDLFWAALVLVLEDPHGGVDGVLEDASNPMLDEVRIQAQLELVSGCLAWD